MSISGKVQSIIFDKDKYTIPKAKKWLNDNNYKIKKIHTTDNYHRFRQFPPKDKYNYRSVSLGDSIKAIVQVSKK